MKKIATITAFTAATLALLGTAGGAAHAQGTSAAFHSGLTVSAQVNDGTTAQDALRDVFVQASLASLGDATATPFRFASAAAANACVGSLRAHAQPLAVVLRLVCRSAAPRLAFALENGVYVFRVAEEAANAPAEADLSAPIVASPRMAPLPAPSPSDNFIIARDEDTHRYETIPLLNADVVDLATVLPLRVLPVGSRGDGTVVPSGIALWGFGAGPTSNNSGSGNTGAPANGGGAPSAPTPGAGGSPRSGR